MKVLSAVKKEMEFNKGLSNLIETLKAIAVSQYRALEHRLKVFKEFPGIIEEFLDVIDSKRVAHPFLKPKQKRQAVVAVTSDSGFLGGLNMQVVNTALSELEKIPGKIIIIGERGKMYVRGTGVPSVNFPGISDDDRYGQAAQMRDYLISGALSGEFSYVKVVYPHPVSFTSQRVETVVFLPFSREKSPAAAGPIGPGDIIMESSPADILEYLVYLWVGMRLYDIFGLSRLAEFAARYIHLEESAQKLKEIDKKTKLEYFRVKHELVDRTMRELFAGRALFVKK